MFIAKIGYPLWLFPSNDAAMLFDGLNDSASTFNYVELPSAKGFLENLENNSKTREQYMAFLVDHAGFFSQPKKQETFTLRSLISSEDFKEEFKVYRKEAVDVTVKPPNLALLTPTLQETAISSMLSEMGKLQMRLRDSAEKFPECLREINKITGQFMTEIDYAAEAAVDEVNAKIKAQEELVNPKVAKLNSDYKRQIAQVTKSFDEELENLNKLKTKTLKFIENNEAEIREYNRDAKAQAKKNHMVYAKGWKEKSRTAKKELDGLKKELNRTREKHEKLGETKNRKNLQVAS